MAEEDFERSSGVPMRSGKDRIEIQNGNDPEETRTGSFKRVRRFLVFSVLSYFAYIAILYDSQ